MTDKFYISIFKCMPAFLVFMVCAASGFAQDSSVAPLFENPEYLVRSFTVEDGLPVNSVNGIVQDNEGYLWFSTYDGLARYNGFEFRLFNTVNTPGMTTNRIDRLFLTNNDLLWLLNANGTVTVKKEGVFETFGKELFPGEIKQITEDHSGQVWIAGSEGISLYDKAANDFRRISHPLMEPAPVSIENLESGGMIIINANGLVHWKDSEAELLISAENLPIPANSITRLNQFDKNILWVTGWGGAFQFDLTSKDIVYTYTPAVANLLMVDVIKTEEGEFTITGTNDLYVYNEKTGMRKVPKEVYANTNRIHSLLEGKNGEEMWIGGDKVFIKGVEAAEIPGITLGLTDYLVDREGSLWIGTYRAGLFQIQRSNFVNLDSDDIPGLDNIYPVIQDKGGAIWAGSFYGGIFSLSEDGFTNWTNQNSSLANNLAHFLYEDRDGTIYAGLVNNGLWNYGNGRWQNIEGLQELLKNRTTVEAMYRKENRLFIGSFNSLIIWENGKFRFFDDDRPQQLKHIGVFRENSRGTIFAGTMGHGLSRINGDSVITYSNQTGTLSDNSVRDIYLQSDDTLWIATENSGLNRLILNPKGDVLSTDVITTADGLAHNSLHRIINDDYGNFWISSNGGLMRISIEALNRYADDKTDRLYVLSFNKNDGLTAVEANGGVQSAGVKSTDGRLWFPTQSGIVIVDPERVRVEEPPNVEIEDIISNEDVLTHSNKKIELEADQRNFELSYTSLTYTSPENVRFRYRLKGFDENWVNVDGRRTAFYTKVPAGTYTFEVQASNNYREWSALPAWVTVVVRPYFYETVWFYLFCGFLLAGVLFVAYRRRIRNLKENEKRLTELVKERTHELRREKELTELQAKELKELDNMKSRFLANLSHEFRTPLTLIMIPLKQMLSGALAKVPEEISGYHRLMLRNSHRLLRLIDQILDLSKLEENKAKLKVEETDLIAFTNAIVTLFEPAAAEKDIELKITHHTAINNVWVDVDNMEKVIVNLITNAIKFTEPGGCIEVKFDESDSTFKIIVSDTGIGISPEQQQHIFDRFYQVQSGDDRQGEGVGIGLALVKSIVELHHGSINLTSEVGRGSAFTVTLKKGKNHFSQNDFKQVQDHSSFLKNGNSTTDEEPPAVYEQFDAHSQANAAEIATKSDTNKTTILVVEDNDDLRNFLCKMLSKTYNVLDANNGAAALEIIEEELPDLIVADIMMPGMDGHTLNSELKKDPSLASIPLIFLTAKDTSEAKVQGLLEGADDYLTKPFEAEVLLARIVNLIESRMRLRKLILEQSDKHIMGPTSEKTENAFVNDLNEVLETRYSDPDLTVTQLADLFHINRSQLYRNLKKHTGLSPQQYLLRFRLDKAAQLLREQSGTVSEIAYAAGFNSLSWFSKSFKQFYKKSPSEYIISIDKELADNL